MVSNIHHGSHEKQRGHRNPTAVVSETCPPRRTIASGFGLTQCRTVIALGPNALLYGTRTHRGQAMRASLKSAAVRTSLGPRHSTLRATMIACRALEGQRWQKVMHQLFMPAVGCSAFYSPVETE